MKPADRPAARRGGKLYAGAACGLLAVKAACFLGLPVYVTWDGHEYIGLAGVLGSERFPADWLPLRAPLLPLALKASFAVLGWSAFAAKAVPAVLGALGCLLVGGAVRRLAGDTAAAATLLVLALFPTLAAFEQTVLTETGTFCFLAMALRLLLWTPATPRRDWAKAAALGLALAGGYYWRSTALALVPWAAFVHALSTHRLRGGRPLRAALQACLVVLVAWCLQVPWAARFAHPGLSGGIARSFLLRQAVIPPEDPSVASAAPAYGAAIEATWRRGPLSGIPWLELTTVTAELPPVEGGAAGVFLSALRRHPGRYLAGVGRTLLFFLGCDGAENSIAIYRGLVLSPVIGAALIGEGRPPLAEVVKRDFSYAVAPGGLRRLLHLLARPYDVLLFACNLATLGAFAVALARRDHALLALAGIPVWFGLVHAILLLSVNRFMVPVYPISLACGIVAAHRLAHVAWTHRPAHLVAR